MAQRKPSRLRKSRRLNWKSRKREQIDFQSKGVEETSPDRSNNGLVFVLTLRTVPHIGCSEGFGSEMKKK